MLLKSYVLCLALGVSGWSLTAQDDQWRVERIRVVPEDLPILNIHVDEANVKWVANTRTLYKVEAKDLATEVQVGAGEMSLLQLPGGNADIRWNTDALASILGDAQVTTAAYDSRQRVLWIGTNGYGIFKLKVEPDLRLVEQLHIDNSRLRSDFINSIFVSRSGKVWIATEDGAVSVQNNQWSLHQKFFNILRIRGRANELWAIGDDLIWIIDRRDNWTPIEINRRQIEGEIHDITVDAEGRVWIASNVMTSYKITTDRYQRFGPGQYFTSQFVNYVSEDDDATIWVGTKDKGLYIIEKESTITVTATMEKHLDCNGTVPDAIVALRSIGGKPPYTYTWASGASGERLTGLGPGVYQVTVTDNGGSKKTHAVEIADPFITVTGTMEKPESAPEARDGSGSVTVTGGVPPYTYEWFSGLDEATKYDLAEGEYGVTVTDAAGCTAIGIVAITQQVLPLQVTLSQMDRILCAGSATASVSASPEGGKNPYQYLWSNGSQVADLLNIPQGQYTVTVTDALGKSSQASIAITQPDALVVTIRIDSPAGTNARDGVASVQVKGGVEPYTYRWNNGETTSTARALGPGRHTVTITDGAGCTAEAAVDILENVLPLASSIRETTEIRCAGAATGSLLVEVQGGKEPFTYQWNNADLSGEAASNLIAGNYTVTVTDIAGNSRTASYTIREPAPLSVQVTADAPALTGTSEGKASVKTSGGTGALTVRWSNGEEGLKASALSAGSHTITVTDAAGCTAVASVDIPENILPLAAAINETSGIRCAGDATGSLLVEVQGGKEPFTYQWNNADLSGEAASNLIAGTYAITVIDIAGNSRTASYTIREPAPLSVQVTADAPALTGTLEGKASVKTSGGTGALTVRWSNGEEGLKASALSADSHTITVTDAAGCTAVASVDIPENILPLAAAINETSGIRCAGDATGSLLVELQGGKEPFTYQWNNADLSGESASNLIAGTYAITVTDIAGNSRTASYTIHEPAPISVQVTADAPALTGTSEGKASVKANGGTGALAVQWSNGEEGFNASALSAGSHTVTVTDAAGCTAVASVEITEDILPLAISLEQTTEIKCHGEATGAVAAQISGGKEPVQIQWSNGITDTESLNRLNAGTYQLSVTDALGSTLMREITLSEPAPLQASASVQSPASTDQSDGKATVQVTGGTTPYDIHWSNSETGTQATALRTGTHTIQISDANGCTTTVEVRITEDILPLAVTISESHSIHCAGDGGGGLEASVQGGKGPFVFAWTDGAMSSARTQLRAGSYALNVTDASGQSTSVTYELQQPVPLRGDITEVRSATHQRIEDGRALAQVSGGTEPYTFKWDDGETAARATSLSVGLHSLTVTDAHGCSITLSAEVQEKILPELTAANLEKGEAVRMEKLQFDADSTKISGTSLPTLEELYAFLYDNPTIVVEIGGHTNGLPEHDYCDWLSTERAKAVAEYITNKGIESKRVIYKGYGKRQPIATNMTPDGRRRNQRVEVRIVKLSD